jgi:hypothetical protein
MRGCIVLAHLCVLTRGLVIIVHAQIPVYCNIAGQNRYDMHLQSIVSTVSLFTGAGTMYPRGKHYFLTFGKKEYVYILLDGISPSCALSSDMQ